MPKECSISAFFRLHNLIMGCLKFWPASTHFESFDSSLGMVLLIWMKYCNWILIWFLLRIFLVWSQVFRIPVAKWPALAGGLPTMKWLCWNFERPLLRLRMILQKLRRLVQPGLVTTTFFSVCSYTFYILRLRYLETYFLCPCFCTKKGNNNGKLILSWPDLVRCDCLLKSWPQTCPAQTAFSTPWPAWTEKISSTLEENCSGSFT